MNRNGQAELEEYAKVVVENFTDAPNKWFTAEIDHLRNPNMGRVSYFWDGHDLAGIAMFSEYQDSNGDIQTCKPRMDLITMMGLLLAKIL